MNNFEIRILERCVPGTTIGTKGYSKSREPMLLVCPNGHERSIVPNALLTRGTGSKCLACDGKVANGKLSVDRVISILDTKGYVLNSEYLGTTKPLTITSKICGHTFDVPIAGGILRKDRDITCVVCKPNRVHTPKEDIEKELEEVGNITLVDRYSTMKTKIRVIFNACGHINTILPMYFINNPTKCQECADSVKNRFFTKLLERDCSILGEYTTTQTKVLLKENVCGHEYSIYPNDFVRIWANKSCLVCTPNGISNTEKDLINFIKSQYSGWIIENNRSILEGKELDVVLPDLGIAFEYNGVYWHSSDRVDKRYHLNKTIAVNDIDYQLIHINEDEWLFKQDIVKSRIKSLLGTSITKYARKGFRVKEIPFPGEFLDTNHIQGKGIISSVNLGLFLDSELYAVMTFSSPKFGINTADFELVRYCSKLGYNIVGGAGKLLKYFRKLYPNKSVMSYSDKRWSKGNLYSSLGFIHIGCTDLGYKYYKNKIPYSRFHFQKAKLPSLFPEICTNNPNASESEIMALAGYLKMYDCGNDIWLLK